MSAKPSLFTFLRNWLCGWTHSRYATLDEHHNICCSRCNRVVLPYPIARDFPPTLGEHLRRELRELFR